MTLEIPSKWIVAMFILCILSLNLNVWLMLSPKNVVNDEIGAQVHVNNAAKVLSERDSVKREIGRLLKNDSILKKLDENIEFPDSVKLEDMSHEERTNRILDILSDTNITD